MIPKPFKERSGLLVPFLLFVFSVGSGCGIYGLVIGDKLIGVSGNPQYPRSKGGICLRAAAGLNLVYDPQRVLYPLKRDGQRGSNKWKRITWKDALEEISSRVAQLRSSGKIDRFLIQTGADEGYTPASILLKKLGQPTLIDDPYLEGLSRIKGHKLVLGTDAGFPDIGHSDYILNFGANPYESHEDSIPLSKQLTAAREINRARLITFDVRLSNTAGLSDQWHPLRPGTDLAVILSMCKVILDHDLEDKRFLELWTNISRQQLVSHLTPYTPEMAEQASGIDKTHIERIALDFAGMRRAVAFCGGGLTDHHSGTYGQMAILLLNALVGNIDGKGGYGLPRRYGFEEPEIHSINSRIDDLADNQGRPPLLYMTYLSNPVYSDPAGGRIEEILRDEKHIPFYAAVDTHITETNVLADIVLPAATCFESWGLDSREPAGMIPYIGLRQPIVRPGGEALSFSSILAAIVKGIGEDVPYDDVGYIGSCFEKIEGLGGNDAFRHLSKKGFWSNPDFKPRYRRYTDGGFRTPSGRMELYSGKLQKEGFSPLPFYRAINESADPAKGKLFLTTFKAGASASLNPNSKWLSEIFHENPLWINEQTAGSLGLADGQKVNIHSRNGNAVVIVRLTQAVHPEVVSIATGLGHWACGRFAVGKKSKGPDPDTSLIWWTDEKSFHISRVLTGESDKVSGSKGLDGYFCVYKEDRIEGWED